MCGEESIGAESSPPAPHPRLEGRPLDTNSPPARRYPRPLAPACRCATFARGRVEHAAFALTVPPRLPNSSGSLSPGARLPSRRFSSSGQQELPRLESAGSATELLVGQAKTPSQIRARMPRNSSSNSATCLRAPSRGPQVIGAQAAAHGAIAGAGAQANPGLTRTSPAGRRANRLPGIPLPPAIVAYFLSVSPIFWASLPSVVQEQLADVILTLQRQQPSSARWPCSSPDPASLCKMAAD